VSRSPSKARSPSKSDSTSSDNSPGGKKGLVAYD
jgi:peptidylprolyl isomerase/peptidyl-prolyl isomerase G (cyclophilin G)